MQPAHPYALPEEGLSGPIICTYVCIEAGVRPRCQGRKDGIARWLASGSNPLSPQLNFIVMDLYNKTTEEKVAETILQRADKITIGERTYEVAAPTTATLILASEAVSRLPHVKLDPANVAEESIAVAKHCRPLGEVAAILVLGAKNLTETVVTRKTLEKPCFFGLAKRKYEVEVESVIDRKEELAKQLIEGHSPGELNALIVRLLQKMELGDFFGLTTFLTEINLLRPTKVGNETTVSGQ